MNKKELATVVALILLIPVVLLVDRRFVKPLFPEPLPTPVPEVMEPRETESPSRTPDAIAAPAIAPVERIPEAVERVPVPASVPESTFTLQNQQLTLEVTNRGAGIRFASLNDFPKTLADNQAKGNVEEWTPIQFSFDEEPALALDGGLLPLGTVFQAEELEAGNAIRFTAVLEEGGLRFERTLRLGEGYVVRVNDRWINSLGETVRIPEHTLWLGRMLPLEDVSQRFGPFLGVDARHIGGEGIRHYVKQIAKWAKDAEQIREERIDIGFDWFTAKNKFFTQVLTVLPSDLAGAAGLRIRTRAGSGDARVGMVQPGARFGAEELPAGQTLERNFTYYVGPMKLENLRELGQGQHGMIDVRLWPIFVPIGRLMMNGLNGLYSVVRNWGVAIILLTVVVRMLFWPLTQKGAENMKKMSEISPQIKEIREKYKSNPQKMQQATAALYKENKVNPMAGCLPMFVQIPVFFSLYGVLRVAVELRFAEFLWVKDLSEQEALFFIAGFPVNILPLTMGATMILQQRMTPGTMDEQQRKIMMFMPIMFLFICYNMPAGLLLYWTTSNLISIYQSWHTRKSQARKTAAQPPAAPAPAAAPLKKRSPKKR